MAYRLQETEAEDCHNCQLARYRSLQSVDQEDNKAHNRNLRYNIEDTDD